MSNWFQSVGASLSSLGNSVCCGDADTTISAYVGFREESEPTTLYDALRKIIDTTFLPVDGPDHCLRSYKADPDELYLQGWNVPRFIVALAACIILFIPFRVAGLFVSQRNL